MTVVFAWICAVVAAVATLGAAYFFDRSADEGIERARREAEIKTAELEHASEQLRESNKKLDIEQESLKTQNLKLSIELEKARAAHLALEGKLASRVLSDVQTAAIIGSLRKREHFAVTVVRLGDKEANNFATSLIATLQAGGADVIVNNVGTFSSPPYGLLISPGQGIDQLVEALKTADLAYRLGGNVGERTTLTVGLKPPSL
jgi:hypothetical protein